MRKMIKRSLMILLTAGLAAAFLGGCSLWGTSMEDRINMFVDDLNSGNSIHDHIHPDANDYNALKDSASVFDGTALDVSQNGTVTISSLSEGSDSISGDWKNDNATQNFTAGMKEDGLGVWMITSLTVGGSQIFN